MKNYIHILTLAAVMCASLVGASCSREDLPKVAAEPEYTRVELAFDMGALQTRADATAEQGDQISDVTVWAYKVASGTGTTATVEQTPVGWGTKTFTNTYTSTTSAPLYFELPYSASEAQTFRFVAVVNMDAFGSILEPKAASSQPTLTLSETTSYSDLTHAVFQADALMEGYPTSDTPASMPVSHWQDFTIDAGATDLTGTNAKSMNVYRAVAKTQLNARLASTSSSGAALCITSVEIKSASGGASLQGYAIPSQGFMFSDIADLTGTNQAALNPTPSAFGDYQDVATAVPSISLKNTAATGNGAATFTAKAVTTKQDTDATATYDVVGSAFLYENHHATTGTPSTTSPDAYEAGTYYMEINYEYGQATADSSDTYGIVDTTRKTATNYVPLPSVVRNRDYQVNATFEVNLAGVVRLAYTVVDWYDGGTTTLDFSYPTFTVESTKTEGNAPVYSQPVAYYNGLNDETGAFTFKLTITGPLNTEKKYTITHKDNDGFAVKAYKVANDNPEDSTEVDNSTTSITASTGHYYLIKVYPTNAMPTGEGATAPTCSVGITHEASWTGTSEYLLINIGDNNGRKWPDSGDDSHLIKVTQIAAPTNP